MSQPVYLCGYAALTEQGMLSHRGVTPWEADQADSRAVRRDQVLSKPYPAFGKLCTADRLVFATACLLLENNPQLATAQTAQCLALPYGSFSIDQRYRETMRSDFPSPALFSATLPSSPLSEVSIYFKIKGPNRVFCQHQNSGLTALEAAVGLMEGGKSDSALVFYSECWDVQDETIMPPANRAKTPCCYLLALAVAPAAAASSRCRIDVQTRWLNQHDGSCSDKELFETICTYASSAPRESAQLFCSDTALSLHASP